MIHLYGKKTARQTPDDVIYIDHDTTPGVEYTSPEDFGDQPLGTTVVRQFRLKNTSATKTANTINIQCNDSDFAISTDGTTWVVTINIASLGPGAQSATMYVPLYVSLAIMSRWTWVLVLASAVSIGGLVYFAGRFATGALAF